MTEDEAKTKWCPHVRVGGPMQSEAEGTAANRWPADDPVRSDSPYRCIASACMAWRAEEAEQAFLQHTDREGGVHVTIKHGYCGLAGAPR